MDNSVDKIIAICDELKALLSDNGAFTSYGMRLIGKLQRLSLMIGVEEEPACHEDDEEEKGHGNTKIPFGLCQREGIEVDPSWTPWDAWNALAEKGYLASTTYEELRENGKLGGRKMNRHVDQNVVNALKPKENEAVFYSGCADRNERGEIVRGPDDVAKDYAEKNAGATANMLLSDADVPEWDSTDDDETRQIWTEVSRVMAQNARGNVRVYVKQPLRKGNIFEAVELPTLKKNPRVTRIVTVDMNTGEEKEIFRR